MWYIHRICHSKIHSLFTNKELERGLFTFEALRAHEDIQRFITWVRKKPAEYVGRNFKAKRRK